MTTIQDMDNYLMVGQTLSALTREGWRVYQMALNPHAKLWHPRYTPKAAP